MSILPWGNRLEKAIVKKWLYLAKDLNSPVLGLKVYGVYTAGLAAKKGKPYAKDSIDFVLVVHDPLDTDPEALKVWGFKAKGRVTTKTVAEEEATLRYLLQPHVCIASNRVHEEVHNQGERFQLLQHASVYDLDMVVLAVSDSQSDLIWSNVVDFSVDLKGHFGNVLATLKEIALFWMYPDAPASDGNTRAVTIPDSIASLGTTIRTVGDKATMQVTANIWKAMVALPKPFPSFKRLIPEVCAFWNAVKGGSDTATKLMDNQKLRVPKFHLNPETAAVTRITMLVFVAIHCLIQIETSRKNLKYKSLYHY